MSIRVLMRNKAKTRISEAQKGIPMTDHRPKEPASYPHLLPYFCKVMVVMPNGVQKSIIDRSVGVKSLVHPVVTKTVCNKCRIDIQPRTRLVVEIGACRDFAPPACVEFPLQEIKTTAQLLEQISFR